VTRIYPLDGATTDRSFIGDVRFNGQRAYVTDAGAPAIIVLDLQTGNARRVLERDKSTTAQRPISAEGVEQRYQREIAGSLVRNLKDVQGTMNNIEV
jgi:hypothetical protein